jgi:hypothetical protein
MSVAPWIEEAGAQLVAIPANYSTNIVPQDVVAALERDLPIKRKGFQFIISEGQILVKSLTSENKEVTPIDRDYIMAFCRGFMSKCRG